MLPVIAARISRIPQLLRHSRARASLFARGGRRPRVSNRGAIKIDKNELSACLGEAAGDPQKRRFLKTIGGAAVALSLPKLGHTESFDPADHGAVGTADARKRWVGAYNKRVFAALNEAAAYQYGQTANDDETALPNYTGVFSKGLPHNDLGEVDPAAYQSLLAALATGASADLAKVPMGTSPPIRLANSRAGFNFALIGQDPQGILTPPAPTFSSSETGAEMVEQYWGAMIRDVPFINWSSDPTIAQAATDLSKQPGYKGPGAGAVTPDNIFRMNLPGVMNGPWLSQFYWMPVFIGAYSYPQVINPPLAGVDYSTNAADWLLNLRGGGGGATPFASTTRYISNARDLTRVLQLDAPSGFPGMYALLAQLNLGRLGLPRNPSLPPIAANDNASLNFFGGNVFQEFVTALSGQALTSVFWHKWQVHRRIRPEAYGGRVHNTITKAATYPVSTDLLNSDALKAIDTRNGNYFLPMAWKGGCPPHPSYPSAHAVISGASITFLKAFYDGSATIPNPVVANADGSALVPYTGAPLTVEGELNKLAMNSGVSRIHTGIHYRSDVVAGLLLGEQMAISYLRDIKSLYADVFSGFTFNRFDATKITV